MINVLAAGLAESGPATSVSAHLCECPSNSRTQLFLDNVAAELESLLTLNNNTDSELAYWLVKYIHGRGRLKFAELGSL